ncbi:MAG: serine/threonine-protein kinase [Wenzhouxiangellaceae bacterium]|nr:serine/threonine-protein kinase [Wenzhouxiangellaceae bacterium]
MPAQVSPFDYREVIGREFGNVVIVRELGSGSMGAVFVGYQKSLKRQVAVKLLRKTSANSERAQQQFRDEAETVAVLSHPYIVPIFETGEDETFYFQVMQLVVGADLGKLVRNRSRHPIRSKRLIAPGLVIDILSKVLEGLGHAHRQGVIHQDIKPANIMIEESTRRPLIVDFGIAKTARIEHWADGMVVGSVLYLSPEQAAAQDTDARSDIYAMGMVLFEVLSGALPVRPDEDENQLLVRKIRHPESLFIRRPADCSPHIDEVMERIILKAIAPARDQRFGSCDALRSALLQWKRPEPA